MSVTPRTKGDTGCDTSTFRQEAQQPRQSDVTVTPRTEGATELNGTPVSRGHELDEVAVERGETVVLAGPEMFTTNSSLQGGMPDAASTSEAPSATPVATSTPKRGIKRRFLAFRKQQAASKPVPDDEDAKLWRVFLNSEIKRNQVQVEKMEREMKDAEEKKKREEAEFQMKMSLYKLWHQKALTDDNQDFSNLLL